MGRYVALIIVSYLPHVKHNSPRPVPAYYQQMLALAHTEIYFSHGKHHRALGVRQARQRVRLGIARGGRRDV